MFKRLFVFAALIAAISFTSFAFDWKDLKNALGGDSQKGSDAGNLLGSIVSGLLSSEELSVADLEGTWKYDSPAVSFKSENLLKKAGGAAAASSIEKKLVPYYKTTGLDKLEFTVEADSSFTFKVRNMTLQGKIESIEDKNSDENFRLTFTAVNAVKLGSYDAYISKTGKSQMQLMFDVSKLMVIAQKVSSITKDSTISTASTLLQSYDGITAGFRLTKSK